MGDVPADILIDAARRYAGMRRWYWRTFFGLFALQLPGMIAVALGQQSDLPFGGILVVAPGIALLICLIANLVAWSSLMRFRCPRCAKRFMLTWWSSWPTSTCNHCGLGLGSIHGPIAKEPSWDPDA